jgi:hypothetical protein
MTTTIYLAHIADRHTDTTAHPFTHLDDATLCARTAAETFAHTPDHIQEADTPPEGWLYYVTWSPEGDAAWVTQTTLDERPDWMPPPEDHPR